MASRLSLKLHKKIPLTHNVTSFVFRRPEGFNFLPGQYVRIFDPIVGEPIFRDFSIVSSPFERNELTLVIEHSVSEYKKRLFSQQIGSEFWVEAPMGRFYLSEVEKRPQVFLAGGVGVAPFYSMIQSLTSQKKELPLVLITSYSTVEDILFAHELEDLQKQNSYLQIVQTISQPERSQTKWSGDTGRINEDLIMRYVKDIRIPQFLISGSPSFVSDMEDLLLQMGLGLNQIRTEVFLGFY